MHVTRILVSEGIGNYHFRKYLGSHREKFMRDRLRVKVHVSRKCGEEGRLQHAFTRGFVRAEARLFSIRRAIRRLVSTFLFA